MAEKKKNISEKKNSEINEKTARKYTVQLFKNDRLGFVECMNKATLGALEKTRDIIKENTIDVIPIGVVKTVLTSLVGDESDEEVTAGAEKLYGALELCAATIPGKCVDDLIAGYKENLDMIDTAKDFKNLIDSLIKDIEEDDDEDDDEEDGEEDDEDEESDD